MNRSKRSSKSAPPEEPKNEAVSGDAYLDGLPPMGRSSKSNNGKNPDPNHKNPGNKPGKTEEAGSSSMSNPSSPSYGSGEKKKKFSFFNLFKSSKPSSIEVEGNRNERGRPRRAPGENVNGDGMISSSSYESLNSVDTTSSFTFVSSKKLRGKGHKGKRIPVDEPTLPRPTSSCSSNTGNNGDNSCSGSGSTGAEKEKSLTMSRTGQPHTKKLGTLSRIGVKMGLKKKYNLQSCESLEHLGSLPRQTSVAGGQKKGGKKFPAGSVPSRTSVVIEDEPSPSCPSLDGQSKNGALSPDSGESHLEKSSERQEIQHKDDNGVVKNAGISLASNSSDNHVPFEKSNSSQPLLSSQDDKSNIQTPLPKNQRKSATLEDEEILSLSSSSVTNSGNSSEEPATEPVPCSSKSIIPPVAKSGQLSPSGYASDNNAGTWSSSTKRKRRAPAPPARDKFSNVITISGQQQDGNENNVELKSVRRLAEDDIPSSSTTTASSSSYPSGALRRKKSKEKSHIRPYSCSCSNSIFAHHSKYQTLHKRYCNHEPHNHAHPSTSNATNNGTLGRSHVKGKKKAPPPPPSNPFEDDVEELQAQPSKPEKNKNPENPYGNPFLDENNENSNEVKGGVKKEKVKSIITITMVSKSGLPNLPSSSPSTTSATVATTSLQNGQIKTTVPKSTSIVPQHSSSESSTTPARVDAPSSSRLTSLNKNTSGSPTTPLSHAVTFTTSSYSSRPISSSSLTDNSQLQTVPFTTSTVEATVISPEDDEIAQNLENDRQEQELLASGQEPFAPSTSIIPTIVGNTLATSAAAEVIPPTATSSSRSSNQSASGSKRIFNFSRNRNSNSHLQPDAENSQIDMESLVNSSPTLMAQAKAVDDQVKAQLQNSSSNKKQGGGGIFSTKSNKSDSVVLSPPLSPAYPPSTEDSSETKAATPRPWYKRSISSSLSPSKSPPSTKTKPTPIKMTHLTKFSDLDREAQRIVEENKRKSAELAFNQNARDLINIFNTSFTTGSSSSTTSTSAVTVARIEGSNSVSSVSGSSSPCTSSTKSDPLSSTASTSNCLPLSGPTSASNSRYLGRSYAKKNTEITIEPKNVAVVQPQKNTGQAGRTTSTSTSLTDAKISVTSSTSTSTSSTSNLSPSSISVPVTNNSSSPVSTSSKLTTTTTSSFIVTPKPLIGESWTCPRCTLKNPAWRALCEACYFRKFGANVLNTTLASSSSVSSASISTFSSANTSCNPTSTSTNTTNALPNLLPSPAILNNCNGTPSTTNQSKTPPLQINRKIENGTRSESSSVPVDNFLLQKKPTSCENFLSQHPTKEELLKDEKLQGMQLSHETDITVPNKQSQEDELDVEKLRQVRVAFFSKEQQGRQLQKKKSMNLNIQVNHSSDSEDDVDKNSISNSSNAAQNVTALSENSISSQQINPTPTALIAPPQKFDDGEDDSIDAMLRLGSVPPKLPPKNNGNTNHEMLNSSISSDAGPNFQILLSSNHNVPQAYISPPHSPSSPTSSGPIFRFRPMLEAITESDANSYYTTIPKDDEVDSPVYQNWQQPATPTPNAYQHEQQHRSHSTHPTNGFTDGNAYPPLFIPSPNLHNTSAVHPHLFLQNIPSPAPVNPLASHSSANSPTANFRLFCNPILSTVHPAPQNNYNNDQENLTHIGFDLGSAFSSNSHFLNSGFTSESEPEADSDMERQRRKQRGYNSGRDRDNRHWNGHEASGSGGRSSAGYSGERHLSYDDYRRLGAIPKGYGYSGGNFEDSQQRRFGGSGPGSGSDSGRRAQPRFNPRSQYGDEDDARYFSESSENSMAENPLVASKLLRKLEWAIANGERKLAASLAHDLALKVNCVVSNPNADPITIRIYVEDRAMQQGPFLVQVLPTMTLKNLKSKIEGDWGIPAGFQKWILGKKMAEDDFITLANYDVVQDTMAFLYLVTPQIENLGGKKEREISPPPPPLPKKPLSSPSPVPQQRPKEESSISSGSGQAPTQLNQLAKGITSKSSTSMSPLKKVASSAQTDDNSLTGPIMVSKGNDVDSGNKKARMPDPVDEKKVPLYERPKSPTRGERPLPVGRIIPKESSESIQSFSPKKDSSRENYSSQQPPKRSIMANSGESGGQSKSFTAATSVSSAETKSTLTTNASAVPNNNVTNTKAQNNHLPLSLHAKLENLRLAAEQAFGKSFSIAQQPCSSQEGNNLVSEDNLPKKIPTVPNAAFAQNPQPSGSATGGQSLSHPGPSLPKKKTIILPTTPTEPSGNAKSIQSKDTNSQKERRQVSKPEQSIIAGNSPNENDTKQQHLQQPSTSKSVKSFSNKPITVLAETANITAGTSKSDPVPKPRTKKAALPDPDSETEKTTKLAPNQQANAEVSATKPKQEKVEGCCQTTLPFPGVKNKYEESTSSSNPTTETSASHYSTTFSNSANPTNVPTLSPANKPPFPPPTSCSPNAQPTPAGLEFTQNSNMIIGNVLVSPIINHVLLGSSALLRALSPLPPSEIFDATTSQTRHSHDVSTTNAANVNAKKQNEFDNPKSTPVPNQSPETSISGVQTLSNDKVIPPKSTSNNSPVKAKPKQPFKLPYFMQQLCAEELANNKKQSSPPSKVKMIAEKFNSSSSLANGKVPQPQSSSFGLQRKYSDTSNTSSMANSYGQVIGRRKSETAAGTILTFSDESKESNIQTYLSMLQMMEKQDLIFNTDDFECPVCMTAVCSGDGVTLRDCLHNFCKDCLIGAVQYAEDSEVQCPFRNDSYSCESPLQEREIKALVPADVFESYLTRSVRLAERKMMNTFHCKTPDCPGWCIFEDDVNIFKCPVCKKKNCITCAAIHDDIDCQQYQRQLAIDAETDEDAKSSRLMLETMIQKGDALECPACHVVLLKKWGCDWVRCTYCKTEICWVTKKLRWGPAGRGDMSGGCKCGLNNIKCHPKCTYCH